MRQQITGDSTAGRIARMFPPGEDWFVHRSFTGIRAVIPLARLQLMKSCEVRAKGPVLLVLALDRVVVLLT